MEIKNTKRIIEYLFDCKKNFDNIRAVSKLEPKISHATFQADHELTEEIITKVFHKWLCNEEHWSDEDSCKFFKKISILKSTSLFYSSPYFRHCLNTSLMNPLKIGKIEYKKGEILTDEFPTLELKMSRSYHLCVLDNDTESIFYQDPVRGTYSLDILRFLEPERVSKNVNGNVLILGGNLGYLPYIFSLNKNVKSITVVDENPDVCDFLMKNVQLLGFCPIFIKNDNPRTYLEENKDFSYQYVYCDCWNDLKLGAFLYKELIQFEKYYPQTKFDYWLEDLILDQTVFNIFQYFTAKLGGKNSSVNFENIASTLWNALEKYDYIIERPDQIEYFLSRHFAKEILKREHN